MQLCCAKKTERIDVLLGLRTPGSRREIVMFSIPYHEADGGEISSIIQHRNSWPETWRLARHCSYKTLCWSQNTTVKPKKRRLLSGWSPNSKGENSMRPTKLLWPSVIGWRYLYCQFFCLGLCNMYTRPQYMFLSDWKRNCLGRFRRKFARRFALGLTLRMCAWKIAPKLFLLGCLITSKNRQKSFPRLVLQLHANYSDY